MKRCRLLTLAAVCGLLAAAPAQAAVRYAAPGGSGTGECTDPAPGGANPPCHFKYAVEGAAQW